MKQLQEHRLQWARRREPRRDRAPAQPPTLCKSRETDTSRRPVHFRLTPLPGGPYLGFVKGGYRMKSWSRAKQWAILGALGLGLLLFGLSSCGNSTPPSGNNPGFSMALNPSQLSATAGGSATTTLTITPQNGFSGTVNLSLIQQDGSPAPSGLTLSPTQVNVSGQTTKSLQIHISSSVEAKSYSLRLVGQSSSSTAYADFNLTINEEDGGWVERNSGTSAKLIDTIYGGDLFVAVGWNGTVLTSPDGISWSMHDSGTNNHLHDVTYGLNQYIAVGQDGTILTSSDGISWEKQDSATFAWLSGSIYASGKFVVIGDYGTILTSTDGTNWSKQNSGTYRWLVGIAYASDRNLFVVVGLSGTILTSTDGEHWTARNSSTTYNLEGVAYGDGRFVAVGANGTILTSSDGISWSSQNSRTDSDLFDPTYGNDQFVVVGDNGTILSWRPK